RRSPCHRLLSKPASVSLRRSREVRESLCEVGKVIAFGPELTNPDGLRADIEGTESASEASYSYVLIPVVGPRPGTFREYSERIDERGGKQALHTMLGKDEADVCQE